MSWQKVVINLTVYKSWDRRHPINARLESRMHKQHLKSAGEGE